MRKNSLFNGEHCFSWKQSCKIHQGDFFGNQSELRPQVQNVLLNITSLSQHFSSASMPQRPFGNVSTNNSIAPSSLLTYTDKSLKEGGISSNVFSIFGSLKFASYQNHLEMTQCLCSTADKTLTAGVLEKTTYRQAVVTRGL